MKTSSWSLGGLCALMALTGSLAQAASFNGFDLALVGSAEVPGSGDNAGNLVLTPSVVGGVGAAWLTTPVSTSNAFSTTFSFSLTNVGGLGNADGIAFVFQNTGTAAIGSGGGNLGVDVPDNTTPGGSVAAVFQSFWQTHGVVQNTDATPGPFNNAPYIGAPDDLSAASVITGTETVSYDPLSHTVSQQVDFSYTVNGVLTSLTRSASGVHDLSALFGPTMTVGLTGATGAGYTDQVITDWKVSAVPEPSVSLMVLVGAGVAGWSVRRRSA